MRLWNSVRARLTSIVLRGRREADLDEELRFHVERETERLVAAGVDPHDARQQARRAFGSVQMWKDEARDARGTTVVDHLSRDVRHAARRLRRDWRFTAAAVLILGLGIGVNAAIFSVINAVLFRPQTVVNPDTLVDIYQNAPGGAPRGSSYAAYLDMAAYTDIFESSAVTFIPHAVTYADGAGPPRQAIAENTSASYLTVLGLRPALGRWFTESEDALNAPPVAVLGYRAWTTRFGADRGIIGRIVRIDGIPVTVPKGTLVIEAARRVGVMPSKTSTPRIFAPSRISGSTTTRSSSTATGSPCSPPPRVPTSAASWGCRQRAARSGCPSCSSTRCGTA